MTVAFDAFSNATGVNPSWTHTPVGTPRGVIVFMIHPSTESPTATYGGTSMGSPVVQFPNSVGGETAGSTISAWVLGTGIPTGARTVVLTGSGSGGAPAWAYTVTADADVEFVDDVSVESTNISNVSGTLALGGRASFCCEVWFSGEDAPASVSPLANWTDQGEQDFGAVVVGSYSYDIVGTSDVTAGLTQSADDILLLAIAVSEVVSSGGGAVIPVFRHHYLVAKR